MPHSIRTSIVPSCPVHPSTPCRTTPFGGDWDNAYSDDFANAVSRRFLWSRSRREAQVLSSGQKRASHIIKPSRQGE
ncbi:hypothetical protein BBOMB_0253 [Bifidobacterium bombi DSM 19703]|uniref:Uncharacterized protein n=1 Tax=Bifidobacterium bombi DSM 19703 TaxID=1341695 RepID=A0A080N5R6_9BIFI|nr:hypothetical protein BBOMB_0253 [Bifidobacterium bombi DSM 19703]